MRARAFPVLLPLPPLPHCGHLRRVNPWCGSVDERRSCVCVCVREGGGIRLTNPPTPPSSTNPGLMAARPLPMWRSVSRRAEGNGAGVAQRGGRGQRRRGAAAARPVSVPPHPHPLPPRVRGAFAGCGVAWRGEARRGVCWSCRRVCLCARPTQLAGLLNELKCCVVSPPL